ncbi:MAG TPA: hypothetical protein VE178_12325 [Silvibacterium sp.]|nr:hypothetical protein [Silvibacterium sp.]
MGALATAAQGIIIDIGGMPVVIRSDSPEFLKMLERRYSGFIGGEARPGFEIDVELVSPGRITEEDDVAVRFKHGRWIIERGDLHAEWEPRSRRGRIVQSQNPYSIDTALRIIHSLILAQEGGLLIHAASAVRNGKAFLFAGVSGAGKTTISRLAPADATLLTDEISYIRRNGHGYVAYGTPFAGELARVGENVRAPLAGLYLLEKGLDNAVEPVGASEAARLLLANVLFFANDPELVRRVFELACELVRSTPVYRLTFFPDERVWELIA